MTLARTAASETWCSNIFVTFGATETGAVCIGEYRKIAAVPLSVGTIMQGVEVEAVDDADIPLPPGVEETNPYPLG